MTRRTAICCSSSAASRRCCFARCCWRRSAGFPTSPKGHDAVLTIDSQVHAYEHNHPDRPWAGVLPGPAAVTGDDMVVAMAAAGVDAALLVSAFSFYRYDASYA